jgi:PIN domain nuclease of toxin-antitoxin system
MPRYFLDSSALIKYYHNEAGSPAVGRILGEARSEQIIARLTWAEILLPRITGTWSAAFAPTSVNDSSDP